MRVALAFILAICPAFGQEPDERQVSLNVKSFASNFLSDQKMIWTFPLKLATGSHIAPTLAAAGATAGLVAADPSEGRYFVRHADTFSGFNRVFSENHTTAGVLLTPAAF